MSQILVWKSDTDSKLFEHKDQYLKHLRVLAKERAYFRALERMRAQRAEFLTNMGTTVTCIRELEEFITANWQWFVTNGADAYKWRMSEKNTSHHELVSLQIDVRWSDTVSNSHSCPRSGVQNWGGSALMPDGTPAPRSYPGWAGHIAFKVNPGVTQHKRPQPQESYGGSYFENTTIKTGSGGGGGSGGYRYDLKLYAEDFPAMALARDRAQVWSTLSDQDVIKEFA